MKSIDVNGVFNGSSAADVPNAYLAVLSGKEEFVCVTEEGQNFIIDGTCIRNQTGKSYLLITRDAG